MCSLRSHDSAITLINCAYRKLDNSVSLLLVMAARYLQAQSFKIVTLYEYTGSPILVQRKFWPEFGIIHDKTVREKLEDLDIPWTPRSLRSDEEAEEVILAFYHSLKKSVLFSEEMLQVIKNNENFLQQLLFSVEVVLTVQLIVITAFVGHLTTYPLLPWNLCSHRRLLCGWAYSPVA